MIRNTGIVTTGVLIATAASMAMTDLAAGSLTLQLGGGWQATIVDPDHVSLNVQSVSLEDDVLVIQKIADFMSIDPFTGVPSSTSIVFSQVATDALTVGHIVINDEMISNHTGLAWTGFRNEILGSAATFDPISSAGFSISPFTTTTYSAGFDQVTYGGGLLADGSSWTPGLLSGALVMSVDLSGSFPVTFVLKETPQVPAPGVAALLAVASLVGGRRRRL